MNKFQARQVNVLKAYVAKGYHDIAARGLSALIRSAMRQTQANALMREAKALGIDSHPEFIV